MKKVGGTSFWPKPILHLASQSVTKFIVIKPCGFCNIEGFIAMTLQVPFVSMYSIYFV
jgi:hypothetical protein